MLVAFAGVMMCSCTGNERVRSTDGTLVLELGGVTVRCDKPWGSPGWQSAPDRSNRGP